MTRVLIPGADMARAFAAAGHEVVITGRNADKLEQVAGPGISTVTGDVGDPEQVRAMFDAAPFGKVTAEHWARMITTNLTGTAPLHQSPVGADARRRRCGLSRQSIQR